MEQLYIKKISSYYFSTRCEIEVAKFSKFCSKLLEVPKEYCFHLCYYLVYGKLVSNSFIKAMISSSMTKEGGSQDILRRNINKLKSKEVSSKKLKKSTLNKEENIFGKEVTQF